jgi:leader peptidase (prepilin peptidase)/N-methyltransferase
MAIVGVIAGLGLDAVIARLSREPYERVDSDEEPDTVLDGESPRPFELSSEAGSLVMPRALTSASMYRRLAVVGVTALIFALVGYRYEAEPLHVAIVAAYAAVLVICTGTDLLAYRVANVVTYPAIIAAITVGLVMPDANRADVLVGGALTGGTFLLMSILTRGGMGMGDVKLSFFTGFALGLTLGIQALLITAIGGGVIAVVLLLSGLRSRRDPIPYAPFIAGGALYVLLVQGVAFAEL